MKIFENIKVPIEKLHEDLIKDFIPYEEYISIVKSILSRFEKENDALPDRLVLENQKKNIFFRILKVADRVRLVRGITNLKFKPEEFVLYYSSPGLLTYLLLTCFDQLGQSNLGYYFFPNWINSDKTKSEKSDVFKSIDHTIDLNSEEKLGFISQVYLGYHDLHGVKNSFFNFLRNILPSDQSQNLLSLIKMEIHILKNEEVDKIAPETNDGKENWLFKVRNNYTHNLTTTESPFWSGFYTPSGSWNIREEIHSKNKAVCISVRDNFREEIEKSILIGIVEVLKSNGDDTV